MGYEGKLGGLEPGPKLKGPSGPANNSPKASEQALMRKRTHQTLP